MDDGEGAKAEGGPAAAPTAAAGGGGAGGKCVPPRPGTGLIMNRDGRAFRAPQLNVSNDRRSFSLIYNIFNRNQNFPFSFHPQTSYSWW